VFPVRYGLNLYILLRKNSVFKGLRHYCRICLGTLRITAIACLRTWDLPNAGHSTETPMYLSPSCWPRVLKGRAHTHTGGVKDASQPALLCRSVTDRASPCDPVVSGPPVEHLSQLTLLNCLLHSVTRSPYHVCCLASSVL
jgi:hypothetical protein